MRRKEHDWTPKALDCSTLQSIADKEFTNRDQAVSRESRTAPKTRGGSGGGNFGSGAGTFAAPSGRKARRRASGVVTVVPPILPTLKSLFFEKKNSTRRREGPKMRLPNNQARRRDAMSRKNYRISRDFFPGERDSTNEQ